MSNSDFTSFTTPEAAQRRLEKVRQDLVGTLFEAGKRVVTGLSVGQYSHMTGGHPNAWGICLHWRYVDRPDLPEFGPASFIRHRRDGTSYVPQN